MRAVFILILAVFGVFIASLLMCFSVYGAFTVFNANSTVVFHFEKSGDLASWIQAIASVAAILAASMLALYIQRRDHRYHTRGPIEVALKIALISLKQIARVAREMSTTQAIDDIAKGKVYFDIDGFQSLAEMATNFPIHELRDGNAASNVITLGHTLRQLNSKVKIAVKGNGKWTNDDIKEFVESLRLMQKSAQGNVDALRKALTTI